MTNVRLAGICLVMSLHSHLCFLRKYISAVLMKVSICLYSFNEKKCIEKVSSSLRPERIISNELFYYAIVFFPYLLIICSQLIKCVSTKRIIHK